MPEFTMFTEENAPEETRAQLSDFKRRFGFIPNMQRTMALSPIVLKGYLHSFDDFAKTSFNPVEREVVLITTSFLNNCTYCVAGHSGLAKLAKMPPEILNALRDGSTLPDPKLQALHVFTKEMVLKRGMVTEADQQALLDAGYEQRHLLEVVIGIAHKVISNYINQMVQTPLDAAFKPNEWRYPGAA